MCHAAPLQLHLSTTAQLQHQGERKIVIVQALTIVFVSSKTKFRECFACSQASLSLYMYIYIHIYIFVPALHGKQADLQRQTHIFLTHGYCEGGNS
jgi:hypothetical protein